MTNPVLNDRFVILKDRIDDYLKQFHQTLVGFDGQSLLDVVSELRSGLNEPFLFVVVGEVKSGKSSFINALLGENICRVDAAPCTDVIQQIVFAASRFEESIHPLLKKIGLPLPILQTIAIVDTPGTNTVIENHQEITRKFIPSSDLILMVFQAKNPYTQSAWDLLDYIREDWRKRTVFILQQADIARPDEIKTNMAKVRELALQKGITDPQIFATSAEHEIQGVENSGFTAVRRFIRETITGGRHYRLKLESILETAAQVTQQVEDSLEDRRQRLASDQAIVNKVKQRLASGHKQAAYELKSLIARLNETYQQAARKMVAGFSEGLAFRRLYERSIRSVLGRKTSLNKWLEKLQTRFESDLRQRTEAITEEGAAHFVEGLQILLQQLLKELDAIQAVPISEDNLFRRIDHRRNDVIDAVKANMAELIGGDTVSTGDLQNTDALGPSLVGGSALTAVGAFFLVVTHGLFFDITGGILTGTGLLLAGGVLLVRRGKLIAQLEGNLEKGREQFQAELNTRLSTRLNLIFDDIDRNFLAFYEYVAQEEARLNPVFDQMQDLQRQQQDLLAEIGTQLPE
ncbi:MAG: dynamin family protein [Desulfobacterales bacterium]|nr:dynamin family protein [Desulfobacterales bacterium]